MKLRIKGNYPTATVETVESDNTFYREGLKNQPTVNFGCFKAANAGAKKTAMMMQAAP